MGLTIKTYDLGYSTLHILREAALRCDGIEMEIRDFYQQGQIGTKYREFVNHSDCDGVYVSKSSKQYDKLEKKWHLPFDFGDLDKLKEEVKELDKIIKEHLKDDYYEWAWKPFYNDVISSKNILEFR